MVIGAAANSFLELMRWVEVSGNVVNDKSYTPEMYTGAGPALGWKRKRGLKTMSVIFGRWNLDGQLPALHYLDAVGGGYRSLRAGWWSFYSSEGTSILCHAFHTTRESRHELQPFCDAIRSRSRMGWTS